MLPLPRPRKLNNVESDPWPCPKLFQNYLLHVCQGSGWRPEWKMCSSWQDHAKSTMSSQPPDHAPSFSKMALGISIGAQVGNLSWKIWVHCQGCKKSTMLNQAIGTAPNFSNIVFHMSVGLQVGSLSARCAPPHARAKSTMSNQAPHPAPNFSKMPLGISVRAQVENLSWKI